jgi:hypothetical protein
MVIFRIEVKKGKTNKQTNRKKPNKQKVSKI